MKIYKTVRDTTEPVRIPDTEFEVLSALIKLGAAHAPAIARATNGAVSVAAVYKLLSRLEQREVVTKEETTVPVGDIQVRRVIYKVNGDISLQPIEANYDPSSKAAQGSTRRTNNSSVQEISNSEILAEALPS